MRDGVKMEKSATKNIITTISIVFLILAVIGGWSSEFYTLLRLVVFSTSAYLAWLAFKYKQMNWGWGYIFIALLFNPLLPIYLNRGLWAIIDLLVAVVLIISLSTFKPHEQN